MDPLSVSASILAILGAGGKVGGCLKRILDLKNAPDALLALNNEVNDVRLIVGDIEDLLQRYKEAVDSPLPSSFIGSLESTRATALAVESFISYELTTIAGDGESVRVDKSRWLRSNSEIQQLKSRIQSDKSSLSVTLGILSSSCAIDSCMQTRPVLVVEHGLQDVRKNIEQILQRQHHIEEFCNKRDDREPQKSSKLRIRRKGAEIEDDINVPLASPTYHRHRTDRNAGATHAQVLLSKMTFNSFDVDCRCVCHKRKHNRSPQFLSRVIGSLLLGYQTTPWFTQPCNDHFCRVGTTQISYTYAFPRWLLDRVLQVSLAYSKPRGPELLLRIMRVRDSAALVFCYLCAAPAYPEENILIKVKKLLDDGEASVLDITPRGYTLLHGAMDTGRYQVVELLVKHGADQFYQNEEGMSPYTLAWTLILEAPAFYSTTPLPALFDQSHLSLFDFSELHRALLGLSGKSFDDVLKSADRSTMDAVDNSGRTTLSWAAQRGDQIEVTLLLIHGSDPNKADNEGRTPLHFAVRNAPNGCVEQLIAAKADLEIKDSYGDTPLKHAVRVNAVVNVQKLLKNGAKINTVNVSGFSVLHDAVYFHSHESLAAILDWGGVHVVEDVNGMTFLGYAACFGDKQTLEIISSAIDRDLVDVECREKLVEACLNKAGWRFYANTEGEIPNPIFILNTDPAEWLDLFEKLAEKILHPTIKEDSEWETTDAETTSDPEPELSSGDESDEEEVWQDAPES